MSELLQENCMVTHTLFSEKFDNELPKTYDYAH